MHMPPSDLLIARRIPAATCRVVDVIGQTLAIAWQIPPHDGPAAAGCLMRTVVTAQPPVRATVVGTFAATVIQRRTGHVHGAADPTGIAAGCSVGRGRDHAANAATALHRWPPPGLAVTGWLRRG